MTTEKGGKNLLMNVSKDDLDKIDEILQSRQPEIQRDKKINKPPVVSRFISGSAKLHFPISVLIQASGVVNELSSISKQNETGAESSFNEGNDLDCNISYENTPGNLEDLILLEHNYAVKYSPSVKSKENEDEITMETETPEKCETKEDSNISSVPEVSNISSNSKVSEVSSISTPIRRSRRQIEKLEREQVAATNVDSLDPEVPKEKIVKNEEKKIDNKDSKGLKIETNSNSDIKLSNYKTFADFKKRHLKVVIEDCKNTKNLDESVSLELPKSTVETHHDSLDNKCKNGSAVDDQNIQNLKNSELLAKSKYLRKTKIHKPSHKEFEKSSIHSPLKKRKLLNLIANSNDSLPKKSPECEEKSDKSVNKNVFKERKKTIEHIKQKNLSHLVKKRKKHVSSSEKNSSNSEIHQMGDSPVSKRKKCVSFSEDLLSSEKPEAVARKQRLSSDFKESQEKSASNHPVNSTPIISKIHKKKILKRDNLRLINDGPALFSQPDIMIKVSVDDNATKKEEKEIDSIERPSKVKTTDTPTFKNSLKESRENKEKQAFKDKVEKGKSTLKTQQEKEVVKVMHEGTLTSKLEQDEKGKPILKQEDKDKQASKQEDMDKQASKQENKDKQASEPEGKDKQTSELECKDKHASEPEVKDNQASELEGKDKQDNKDEQSSEQEGTELRQDLKAKSEEGEKQLLKQEEKEKLNSNQEEKAKRASTQDKLKENRFLKAVEEPAEKHCEKEFQEETLKDREKTAYNEKTTHDHLKNFSNSLQLTGSAPDQQKEIQHSYNDFTNIEAFLESSKFIATLQEVEENTSKDSKSIDKSMVEVFEKVPDKNFSKEAPKLDGDEKPDESSTHSESASPMLGIEEPKLIPERKSRRLIKKKEFFGDVDDSSDNKRASASKNKRTSVDKSAGRGNKIAMKNKNTDINGRSDNIEEDSTDPDSSEEDDPKKLWCICRKPHNSRFMIQCDKCEDWFHGSCVGVTKQHGRQLEKQKKEWNCPSCRDKGEPSPLKMEKSKQTAEIKTPNEKNSTNTEHEDKYKKMLSNVKKNSHSSDEQLLNDTIAVKKENCDSNAEKLNKLSTVSIKKQSSAHKPEFKLNLNSNPKTETTVPKVSSSSKQSSVLNTKFKTNSPDLVKLNMAVLAPKGKLSNTSKAKCVNCEKDTLPGSSYCSENCIELYGANILRLLQNQSSLKKKTKKPPLLVSSFNRYNIYDEDLLRLRDEWWLNDNIINFYFQLIQERGKKKSYPSVYVYDTLFFTALMNNSRRILKWTAKIPNKQTIFNFDIVFMPCHFKIHWALVVINNTKKTIQYFDSLGSLLKLYTKCYVLYEINQYIMKESRDKLKVNAPNYKREIVNNIPQQNNSYDCGMFTLKYAEYISRQAKITFSQRDMLGFRNWMVTELLEQKLRIY